MREESISKRWIDRPAFLDSIRGVEKIIRAKCGCGSIHGRTSANQKIIMTQKEQLIIWLRDAHAMETGLVTTLEKHAADAQGMPKVRAAITKHLGQTKRHVTDVQKCLSHLGGDTSTIKTGMAKIGGFIGGLPTSFVKDTAVKNGIADYATEHFEIACYTSLVATATKVGEPKVAALCSGILKDEVAMAKQLETLMKDVNAKYLSTL